MEILRRFFPIAAALIPAVLLAGGCEFVRDPAGIDLVGEQIMVHSVLKAGSDTAAVFLTRVRPGSGNSGPSVSPISGATVRIVAGGDTVQLTEAPAGFASCIVAFGSASSQIGPGCYAAVLPTGIRSDTEYRLLASMAGGGGAIQGAATIPSTPEILRPDPNARFVVQRQYTGQGFPGEISVRLRSGAGTGGVQLDLQTTAVFAGGVRVSDAVCQLEYPRGLTRPATSDTAVITIFNPIFCWRWATPGTALPVEYDSLHARLLVTAYDTAYVRYAAMIEDDASVQQRRYAAGVSGALGLFAGAATADRRITLVRGP